MTTPRERIAIYQKDRTTAGPLAIMARSLPPMNKDQILKQYGDSLNRYTVGFEVEVAVEIDSVPKDFIEQFFYEKYPSRKVSEMAPPDPAKFSEFLENFEWSLTYDRYVEDNYFTATGQKRGFFSSFSAEPKYGKWINTKDYPYLALMFEAGGNLRYMNQGELGYRDLINTFDSIKNVALYYAKDDADKTKAIEQSYADFIQQMENEFTPLHEENPSRKDDYYSVHYHVNNEFHNPAALADKPHIALLVKYARLASGKDKSDALFFKETASLPMAMGMVHRLVRNNQGPYGGVWNSQEAADEENIEDFESWTPVSEMDLDDLKRLVSYDESELRSDYEAAREKAARKIYDSNAGEDEESAYDTSPPDAETALNDHSFKEELMQAYVIDAYKKAIGNEVVTNSTYHGSGPSYSRFRIEPDNSIEPGGAEIISKVFKDGYQEGLDWLDDVLAMIADTPGLTTNSSTGLHINIGTFDAKDIDIVKLSVLLGDKKILKAFNREGNTYSKNVVDTFREAIDRYQKDNDIVPSQPTGSDEKAVDDFISKLNTLVLDSRDRYVSANTEKLRAHGFIEFRMAGGENYHQRVDDLEKLTLQLLRTVAVAQDKKAYRREYLQALYRMMNYSLPNEKPPVETKYGNEGILIELLQKHVRNSKFRRYEFANASAREDFVMSFLQISWPQANNFDDDEFVDVLMLPLAGLMFFSEREPKQEPETQTDVTFAVDAPLNPISVSLLRRLRMIVARYMKDVGVTPQEIVRWFGKNTRTMHGKSIYSKLSYVLYRWRYNYNSAATDYNFKPMTRTLMPMPDWMKYLVTGKQRYFKDYVKRAGFSGKEKMEAMLMTPRERVNMIMARRLPKSPRAIFWHGTTSKFLPTILKHGLDNKHTKEGLWVKDSKITKGEINHQPSKRSYGGIYFAKNMFTSYAYANDAARKLGGTPILIAAILTETSTIPDEDNYNIEGAFSAVTHSGHKPSIINAFVQVMLKWDGSYWQKGANYRSQVLDPFRDEILLRLRIKPEQLAKRADKERLFGLIDNLFIVACKRYLSYYTSRHQGLSYHDLNYGLQEAFRNYGPTGLKEKMHRPEIHHKYYDLPKQLRIPTPEKAEELYRRAVNRFIRITQSEYARYMQGKGKDSFEYRNNTVRMLTPVGFKGRNRIVGIIDLGDRNKNGRRTRDFTLVYGKVPLSFFDSYRSQIDHSVDINWSDRDGNAIGTGDFLTQKYAMQAAVITADDGTDYPQSGAIQVGVQPYSAHQEKAADDLADKMEQTEEEKKAADKPAKPGKKKLQPPDDEGEDEGEEKPAKKKKKMLPPTDDEDDGGDEPPKGKKKKLLPPAEDEGEDVEASVAVEAGINVSMVGNWNKGHSFRFKDDRLLLNSPKGKQKIIDTFAKMRLDVDINAHFVNMGKLGVYAETGQVDENWLQQNMPDAYSALLEATGGSITKPNAVNMIYVGNGAAERYPMTAWIIAHRMSHAFFALGSGQAQRSETRAILNKMQSEFFADIGNGVMPYGYQLKIFETVNLHNEIKMTPGGGWYNVRELLNKATGNKGELFIRRFFEGIGTFKSARDKNIPRPLEFFHECFAQYLLTGNIKFNEPPDIKIGNSTYKCEDADYYHTELQGFAAGLEENMHKAILAAKGKLFVM